MDVVIYCADIGSVPNGRFGWARSETGEATIEPHRGGTEIIDLVEAVADDLAARRAVAGIVLQATTRLCGATVWSNQVFLIHR